MASDRESEMASDREREKASELTGHRGMVSETASETGRERGTAGSMRAAMPDHDQTKTSQVDRSPIRRLLEDLNSKTVW
jgi:hypothetical protein